jgi:hypothetical protein
MADDRNSSDDRTGVGPGVTGASGDLIEGTGGTSGIGGTGEDDEQAASGNRPDERQNPGPQELGNARPDEGHTGAPAGGDDTNAPGGPRNVAPANDLDTSGDRAHRRPETIPDS